jgi:hypothetical protein
MNSIASIAAEVAEISPTVESLLRRGSAFKLSMVALPYTIGKPF